MILFQELRQYYKLLIIFQHCTPKLMIPNSNTQSYFNYTI